MVQKDHKLEPHVPCLDIGTAAYWAGTMSCVLHHALHGIPLMLQNARRRAILQISVSKRTLAQSATSRRRIWRTRRNRERALCPCGRIPAVLILLVTVSLASKADPRLTCQRVIGDRAPRVHRMRFHRSPVPECRKCDSKAG
jgi:hypothetical protein